MEQLNAMLEKLEKEYEDVHKKLIQETKDIYIDCGYLSYVEEALVLKAKIEALEELQSLLEEE